MTDPLLQDGDGTAPEGRSGDVLIDPLALHGQLGGANPPAVLDVRWKLGEPDGRRRFADGHIPTAVYVDLETELAGPPSPAEGRHPLPDVQDLQSAARRWGLSGGRPVVVYDDYGGTSAARAWWLLRWAGIEDVRILDGALAAWTSSGLALETGEPPVDPGDVVLQPGQLPVLDADRTAEVAQGGVGVVLDARAGERYRGEQEPVDPRAGHIPGAVSAPTFENLDAAGAFLDRAALRERFSALGITGEAPIAVYCGSGVTAAHEIAALRIAGYEAALFPGSWSAWSSDPARPAAVGPDPV